MMPATRRGEREAGMVRRGDDGPVLFALAASRAFGERVAAHLGVAPGAHEEREFEDGEHKARPLISVRGRDVFVIQSLYSDTAASVNDKLVRLLFFLGALRDAGAARVTAVVPYLAYARKDRKTQPRDPVTTRYLAGLFEAVGIDRIVVLDVHNLAAYQNAFHCRTEHLEATRLFVDHFRPLLGADDVAVVSPDAGGVKRAEHLRAALTHALNRDVGSAFIEKLRAKGVVSGGALVGEVRGRQVIILDDLISTGTTLARAVAACHAAGARRVYCAATHGLFVGGARTLLEQPELAGLVVTDSVPPFRLDPARAGAKLTVLDCTPLLAEAIRRLHAGGSLVELLEI
jgi:ribose-phosphate pyrophosphokinase